VVAQVVAPPPALEAPPAEVAPANEAPPRQWRDLVFVALLAIAGALATGAPIWARVPLGMLAVLVAPGYALITAVFPTDEHVDILERLGLALAGSFCLIAIQALLLDRAPGGLAPGSIHWAVTGTTLVLAFVAGVRRARMAPGWRVWGGSAAPGRTSRAVRFTRAIAVASLVVAGLSAALAAGRTAPAPTEFYVLGALERLNQYPREVQVGERMDLRVGVHQTEAGAGRYTVSVRHGDAVLATSPPISLNGGARWEDVLSVSLAEPGPDQEITILLQRDGDAAPYRTLRLWVDVVPPGSGSG